MAVTDPSIDPITGLPVLNPSGPVQQIPLGQEVFPYADLNATAQPTRGPIYGDDIIPTSSLITAPDAQMKPRSVQATTTRELRVREAVFQNLGAAIPDGTTAPVDVNVVSGGGGGGGGTPFTTLYLSATLGHTLTTQAEEWAQLLNTTPLPKTFYGAQMTVSTNDATEYYTEVALYLTNRHGSTSNQIPLLGADVWASTRTVKPSFQFPYYSVFFPNGLSLANLFDPATDYPILAASKTQIGTLDLQLVIWLGA